MRAPARYKPSTVDTRQAVDGKYAELRRRVELRSPHARNNWIPLIGTGSCSSNKQS